MDLPSTLRQAIERELDGFAVGDIQRAADALSHRYRGERDDGRPHVSDAMAAAAYLAARLPATYAAIAASLETVREARPSFEPRTLLDVGAGPGTAGWAASTMWPGLSHARLIEASAAQRAAGQRLGSPAAIETVEWIAADATATLPPLVGADLVVVGYVLGELAEGARDRLVDRLWPLAEDTLVIVEPGTPAGWQRVLRARQQLVSLGAHLLAPCPHAHACPLSAPDWCHFSERLPRSQIHRRAKDAALAWEDEKFIYIAASRVPAESRRSRVVAHPRMAGGQTRVKLCRPDGGAGERLFTRREGELYKAARRVEWGDTLDAS